MTLRYRLRKLRRQTFSAVPLVLVASLYVIGDRVSSESGQERSPSHESVKHQSLPVASPSAPSVTEPSTEEVCGWEKKADGKTPSQDKDRSDNCSRKSN